MKTKIECQHCNASGCEDIHIGEEFLSTITIPCEVCNGDGYNYVSLLKLCVTIYTKPLTRQLLAIKEDVNRPNSPDIEDIIEAWVFYNYGNIRYGYCEVDSDKYEIIDEDWNIENYR